MATQYKIVFSGEYLPGCDPAALKEHLSRCLNMQADAVQKLLQNGADSTLIDGLSAQAAEHHRSELHQMGMVVAVQTMEAPQEASPISDNFYRAPAIPLVRPNQDPDDGIRYASGKEFWGWFAESYKYFKKSPAVWFGLCAIYTATYISSEYLPGTLFFLTVVPTTLIYAGMIIGCRDLDNGLPLRLGHAFSAFKMRWGQITLTAVVPMLLLAATYFAIALVASEFLPEQVVERWLEEPQLSIDFLPPLVFFVISSIPSLALMLFSPSLIVLRNYSALKAMQLSFIAATRNLHYLAFSTLWISLFLVIDIVWSALLSLTLPFVYILGYVATCDVFRDNPPDHRQAAQ